MNKKELVEYFEQLVPDGNWNRMGMTFQTEQTKYYYDNGTGKVFSCENGEFLVMENILQHSGLSHLEETGLQDKDLIAALESLKGLVEVEKICQAPVYKKFRTQDIELEQINDIQQVIIELTEQCNLRCKYCIYNEDHENFRGFSTQNMTWDTAKRALDYVFAHCGNKISVTFYGGEPLLQFPLMKQCIDYAIETVDPKKKLNFGFTTNLTLMTKEMAEYFASLESCGITGSLDGPEEIHDANRVMVNHVGSFKKAMDGLKLLIDCMGQERAGKVVGINAVLTPPFTVDKVEYINQFFRSISWIPEHMTIRASYMERPSWGNHEEEPMKVVKGSMKENDPVGYWKLKKICNKEEAEIKFGMENANLMRIHQRLIAEVPIPFLQQNGCCNPGSRRLYITTKGEFLVCERIGKSPVIGDVEHGINMEAIKKYYIDEYAEASLPDCSNCWASQLCSLCYASFYDESGINIKEKRKICSIQRCIVKYDLISYHQILENNPAFIEQNYNLKLE